MLTKGEARHARLVREGVKVLTIGTTIDLGLTIVRAHGEVPSSGVKPDVSDGTGKVDEIADGKTVQRASINDSAAVEK